MVHPGNTHHNVVLPMVTSSSSNNSRSNSNGYFMVPNGISSSSSSSSNNNNINHVQQPVLSSETGFASSGNDTNRFSSTSSGIPSSTVAAATTTATTSGEYGMNTTVSLHKTNVRLGHVVTSTSTVLPVPPTDVTMAYDLAVLPPTPPMGDDHSVPVLDHVDTTTTLHPSSFPQPGGYNHMSNVMYTHHNSNNKVQPAEQQSIPHEQSKMGYGGMAEPYYNNTGQWGGQHLQQTTAFQSNQLQQQGLVDMNQLQQQQQYTALHSNQLQPVPPGMDRNSWNQYLSAMATSTPGTFSWGEGNVGTQQPSPLPPQRNFSYDPYAAYKNLMASHPMHQYTTAMWQQQEQHLVQPTANSNVLPTTFPPPQYLSAMSQQPLHWNMEQMEMAQHQAMNIDPMHVQPKSIPPPLKPKCPPSKEWIDSIVGRDWEIYWKKQGSQVLVSSKTKQRKGVAVMEKEEADDGEDDDDEETWYDAMVISIDTKKSNSNKAVFQVKFVGDNDRLFIMPLTPEDVRPSARAWIRRTKAILLAPGPEATSNVTKWEEHLPKDTSMAISDAAKMKEIDEEIETTFPITLSVTYHKNQDENGMDSFQQLRGEHVTIICPLLKLIRHQIYLRSKLSPIEVDHNVNGDDGDENGSKASTKSDDTDEESVLTEEYVNFMLNCLHTLEKACLWHYECWIILKRLFAVNRDYCASPTKLISKHHLVHECFNRGRDILTLLSQQSSDILHQTEHFANLNTSNRKRSGSDRHDQNATKHRRLDEPVAVACLVSDGRDDHMDNDSDALSLSEVEEFISRVHTNDQRWYTRRFGNMLYSIVDMVLSHYIEWERNARFYLGEDGEAVESSYMSELQHDYKRRSNISKDQRRDIKYEDIELLIDHAKNNRLLKFFDFSSYVKRLCTKLADIDIFEKVSLKLIDQVFKEANMHSRNEDPILRGLTEQKDEAVKKGNAVEGMNPIGHATSRLTVKAIEQAIENRQWFLNLNHAESVRERDAFVKELIAKKPLTGQPSVISELYKRVEALNLQCADQLDKWNIESLLENRTVIRHEHERTEFLAILVAKKVLHELQSQPRISSTEEKLSIRCDVLEWESNARTILENQKPKFADLESLHHGIENIRKGTAANHNYIQKGTLPCSEVDAKMRAFIKAEFDELLGPLYTQTMMLYNESVILKNRADKMLSVIDSFTNRSMSTRVSKRSEKIEMGDIEEVLFEYSGSKVDILETFVRLQNMYDFAKKWVRSMQSKLTDTTQSFEDMQNFLTQTEKSRPLGVYIEPVEKIVASVLHVLRWFLSLKKYMDNDSLDPDLLLDHLVVGMPLLELFCQNQKNTTQFNMLRDTAQLLLDDVRKKQGMIETLDVSKLYSDKFSRNIVERLTNPTKDEENGAPMFFLFHSLWTIVIHDFVARFGTVACKGHATLENATSLWKARPVVLQTSSSWTKCQLFLSSLRVLELNDLISDGEEVENDARSVIGKLKNLHEQHWMDPLPSIFNQLKDIHENFSSRRNKNGQELTLTLNSQLEEDIEKSVSVAGWLFRILPYPSLHIENFTVSSAADDKRIPFRDLASIYKEMPKPHLLQNFSSLQERIKTLFDTASKWEKDVTLLLKQHSKKGRAIDSRETYSKEDFDKIVALSICDFLLKVSTPRYKEICDLIENTCKFEAELRMFFTKESYVDCPDSSTITENSLAAEDGTFNLVLLTGNPLFEELDASISNISEIAARTDLNIAGKVAFEWICWLHRWIKRIQSSISDGIPYCRHISIVEARAYELVSEGDFLFQALPDDLVELLHLYNVYVVTQMTTGRRTVSVKLGKNTVSKSLGSTLMCWASFLFNAVKEDLSQLFDWKTAAMKVSDEYNRLMRGDDSKLNKDPKAFIPYYEIRDQTERLMSNLDDIFFTPSSEMIEMCILHHSSCRDFILQKSSFTAAQEYALSRYSNDTTVIENRLLLLDSLAERTEIARHEVPVSIEINNSSTSADQRDRCRHKLFKALKNRLNDAAVAQAEVNALCSIKAWEIENALNDLCDSDKSKNYPTIAISIKNGLLDVANLQLTLSVLSGVTSAEQLVEMPSEQLSNHDIRKMRDEASETARLQHNLTRREETMANKELSLISTIHTVLNPQSVALNSEVRNSDALNSIQLPVATIVETPVAIVNEESFKAPTNGTSKDIDVVVYKSVPSISRDRNDAPPPAPPSLNPLSASSSRNPALPNPIAVSVPSHRFVTNDADGSKFRLKLRSKDKSISHKVSVQLELVNHDKRMHDLCPGEKILPEFLQTKGFLPYEQLVKFIKDKRQTGNKDLTFKVYPTSDSEKDELSLFSDYTDNNNNGICVLASKCQIDCYNHVDCKFCDAKPCKRLYLITPRFHRQFADEWKTTDPDSMYLITMKK